MSWHATSGTEPPRYLRKLIMIVGRLQRWLAARDAADHRVPWP
jgi:hypothetical protein